MARQQSQKVCQIKTKKTDTINVFVFYGLLYYIIIIIIIYYRSPLRAPVYYIIIIIIIITHQNLKMSSFIR